MLILDAYLLRVYALCYAHDDLQSTGILKNECFVKVLIVRRLSLQYNTIQYRPYIPPQFAPFFLHLLEDMIVSQLVKNSRNFMEPEIY
jgi:hypothetical protein